MYKKIEEVFFFFFFHVHKKIEKVTPANNFIYMFIKSIREMGADLI